MHSWTIHAEEKQLFTAINITPQVVNENQQSSNKRTKYSRLHTESPKFPGHNISPQFTGNCTGKHEEVSRQNEEDSFSA